ncbi:MAG: hypothetical protein FJ000_08245 [Actinobacteria bacterium]|nr:hypothetical protein [Actinomycetota bacterium]
MLPRVGLSPDGPQLALRVGLRVVAAVTCMLFLALTTPLPQVLMVLRRLRVPAVVTEIALLVYRYVWIFAHTVVTMRRAQSARLGYSTTGRSFRSLAMLVAALLGQSIQRGRALELGLESRNWHGELRVLDDGASASVATLALILITEVAVLVTALLWGSLA